MKVANGAKSIYYKDPINNMNDFIIKKYDGKSIKVYKGDWKQN